ncbi:MAG TPA: M56 family metallopeptidase [Gemmatimonadales bacterium]
MIAAWMLYAAVAAVLLSLAATIAERALRVAGRATRWAWAAALAGSVLLPTGAWLAAWRGAANPAEAAADAASTAQAAGGGLSLDELLARATVMVEPSSPLAALDAPLLTLWCAASLGVVVWLTVGMLRLARARREWRPATVAGVSVLVSGRTGPAVAGVIHPAIVLPEWALGADDETLALMLEHEREHVRAADPALLAAGVVAVALAPWNPALWWQLRRLRHAVEVDCDRRVLGRHPDRRTYGALLIEVGRCAATVDDVALPIAAFASTRSSLERRIRTMTMRRPRHPLLQGAALAGGAVLLVLAACETPRPTEVSPVGEIPLTDIRNPGSYATTRKVTVDDVREVLAQVMPAGVREERRGVPHEVWIVADAEGSVLRTETLRRARMEGDSAPATAGIAPDVIASIEILKLDAGKVTADPANIVWVQLKPGAEIDAAPAGGARIASKPSAPTRRTLSLGELAERGDGPKPLVVVDGEIVTDRATLDAIDTQAIESVEVVKGEAARRLYGERGANGVIQVTMKKL